MTPEQRIIAQNNERLDAEYYRDLAKYNERLATGWKPRSVLEIPISPKGTADAMAFAQRASQIMDPKELETCDKCGRDWTKSPVQMRGLASPTTRHPSLGDDRLKHFCDRVCLMRYLLTPEEMKTLRGDKSKS